MVHLFRHEVSIDYALNTKCFVEVDCGHFCKGEAKSVHAKVKIYCLWLDYLHRNGDMPQQLKLLGIAKMLSNKLVTAKYQ